MKRISFKKVKYSKLNTRKSVIFIQLIHPLSQFFTHYPTFSVEYKKAVLIVEELKETLTKCYNELAPKIYKAVRGKDVIFDDQFHLGLRLNSKEDMQLLNCLKAIRLPALKRVRIDYLTPNSDRGVSEFLSNSSCCTLIIQLASTLRCRNTWGV